MRTRSASLVKGFTGRQRTARTSHGFRSSGGYPAQTPINAAQTGASGHLDGADTVGTALAEVSAREPGRKPTKRVTANETASASPAPNGTGNRRERSTAGASSAP